jgi:ABC-type glycerol-3-phosphate transport system permease component
MLLGKLSSTTGGGTATAGVGVWMRSSGVVEAALFLLADSPRAPRAGSFLFLSMAVARGSTALVMVFLTRCAFAVLWCKFELRGAGRNFKIWRWQPRLATPQQPQMRAGDPG